MKWTDCRIVAFDTETTGLLAWDGDRVMEFGAVEIFVGPDRGVRDIRRHGWLINPSIPVPRDASRVTGITDDDVCDSPLFEKRAKEIHRILDDAIIVAHNLPFDVGFLQMELERAGLSWPKVRAEIDTLVVSQRHQTHLRAHKLGAVAKELRVELEEAHRATNDAEACGLVLVEMCKRYDAPDDLEEMVLWADGMAPPPETGHLGIAESGRIVFTEGPHQGDPIENHPGRLHWMTLALERIDGAWRSRYPESLQAWIRRWLRVRASGRAPQGMKGESQNDWNLDPVAWV